MSYSKWCTLYDTDIVFPSPSTKDRKLSCCILNKPFSRREPKRIQKSFDISCAVRGQQSAFAPAVKAICSVGDSSRPWTLYHMECHLFGFQSMVNRGSAEETGQQMLYQSEHHLSSRRLVSITSIINPQEQMLPRDSTQRIQELCFNGRKQPETLPFLQEDGQIPNKEERISVLYINSSPWIRSRGQSSHSVTVRLFRSQSQISDQKQNKHSETS